MTTPANAASSPSTKPTGRRGSGSLLTRAPRASHRVLRHRYVRAIIDQAGAACAVTLRLDEQPPGAVLAAEVDHLSVLDDVSNRQDLGHKVTPAWPLPPAPGEMADRLQYMNALAEVVSQPPARVPSDG